MIRTKGNVKKPDLILCSDMHLREDSPTCFIGDWHQEQWKAVEFVRNLQAKYKCPVIHAGDLFHHWKPSPSLISQALWFLPEQFYTIYGQHDLPQHSLELKSKSGLHTLEVAGKIKVLSECHFGQEPNKGSLFFPNRETDRTVLVWHHLTYINPPYPGATGGNAIATLRKYSQFDLIVTGDNHQSFYTTYEGRILVNPGNLTRQVADQADFQPRVALWYADTNTIEWVNIPIQEGVITREHIEVKQQRDSRIDAFISKLDGDWVAGMSFEENLEAFFSKNQTRESVKQIIYTAIE
jgi:predicted phosphodiesterase